MLVCSLSNTKVQILEGTSGKRLKVKRILEIPLEEGIILNGQILDEERLVEMLVTFWKENKLPRKGVSLVTSDSRFMTKMVELPIISDKEIAAYIPREFDDVEKREPLYGFNHIGKSTKIVEEKEVRVENMLAVMVEREVFGKLIDLFKQAGIQVTNIAASMEGDVRLINRLPQIAGKTCLVQLMDGSNLTNLLYVNGTYKYSNRTRLYSETDTPGYGVEVARSVSNIIQFAKAQQIEEPITDIFVGGISPDSLSYMEEGVFQIDDTINVDWIETGKGIKWPEGSVPFSDCISLVGGLLPVAGAGRLYYHWTHSGKRSARTKGIIKSILPVVLVAVVMFAILTYYGISCMIYQSRVLTEQEY
ncbi:MAG: pilus assembly protein PilM, partial [bacterium]|nr:pilus assembly protein PilM [bacterium]